MCDPVSIGIAGLAASGVGTAMQVQQGQAAAKAQNRAAADTAAASAAARAAERQRQQQFQDQALARFDQQVQDTGAAPTQQGVQSLADRILGTQAEVAAGVDTAGFLPGQDRADAPTREMIAAQIARGAADARRRVAGLARSAGYDDMPGMFATTNQRFGADLGLLSSGARASLALGQNEGNVPAAAVMPGSNLGAILSGAGGLATRYGASRGGFG